MGSQLSLIWHKGNTHYEKILFLKCPGQFPPPPRPEARSWGLAGLEPANTPSPFAPLLCVYRATVRLEARPRWEAAWKTCPDRFWKARRVGKAEWLGQLSAGVRPGIGCWHCYWLVMSPTKPPFSQLENGTISGTHFRDYHVDKMSSKYTQRLTTMPSTW